MEEFSNKVANAAIFALKAIVVISIARVLFAAMGYKYYIPYVDDLLLVTYQLVERFVRWLSNFITYRLKFA